jgi:hypothetical protein
MAGIVAGVERGQRRLGDGCPVEVGGGADHPPRLDAEDVPVDAGACIHGRHHVARLRVDLDVGVVARAAELEQSVDLLGGQRPARHQPVVVADLGAVVQHVRAAGAELLDQRQHRVAHPAGGDPDPDAGACARATAATTSSARVVMWADEGAVDVADDVDGRPMCPAVEPSAGPDAGRQRRRGAHPMALT